MRDYKLVVLGAGGVGKSCLTVQFVQGIYIDSYDPTIEDSYSKEIEVDGRACNLEILDTAGVAQFTAMRELYIKNGQGFLLVYSVTDKQSLQELLAIREQILRIKDTTSVPMVLVGNKCDLSGDRELTPEEGIAVSKAWSKVPFYETSALYRMNVEDSFVDVVRQIIRKEVQQEQQTQQQQQQTPQTQQQQTSPRESISAKDVQRTSTNGMDAMRLHMSQQRNQDSSETKIYSAADSAVAQKKRKRHRKCAIL